MMKVRTSLMRGKVAVEPMMCGERGWRIYRRSEQQVGSSEEEEEDGRKDERRERNEGPRDI